MAASSSSSSITSAPIDITSQEMTQSSSSSSIVSTSIVGRIPENEDMGAFQEFAPSASMPICDVFINHYGPDVKKTLACSIYNILNEIKVKTFLYSEELENGDFLPLTCEAAIRSAILHIAIFSKGYADSAWCLMELSFMLKTGARIIPIYYHLNPTDIRYVAQRKGKYLDAFERHEKSRIYSPQMLQEWKDALYKVSFYTGEIINDSDDERRLIKNIVKTVHKVKQNAPLIVAKHPVGLKEAVEDFENTLQLDQGDHGVQIVGIWGMGGLGKTTLAKELYNKRSYFMEKSSFIFDIREAKGVLHQKQNQLLKDLGVHKSVDNVEQGKAILARHLRSSSVFIVMDDVDHVDQLETLLPAKDSLASGSLIIVTTQEYEVLRSWGISSVHKMKALDPFNAKKLFCWHAFSQSSPFDGFEEHVEKFVEACNGWPLSLELFGEQLYGNSNKQYWESLYHKMSKTLSIHIKEKLKVRYDALNDEEKEAFLDTACFFIGEKSSLAIEVWEGSEWYGLYTWERLVNKCLVEVNDKNCIRMHDNLRELGKEIANQHWPSRLWLSQQIINYDKQRKKSGGIRGIKAVTAGIEEWSANRKEREANTSAEILLLAPCLVGVKILVIQGNYYNQIISEEVSRELLWLRWFDIGQRNLSARLLLKNLRVLELCEDLQKEHHLEELWEIESHAPVLLRELVIFHCSKFQRLPNSIGCLKVLKKVTIRGNNNVRCLPDEFCHLQMLERLELRCCGMLASLPNNFGDLKNLCYLDLSYCRNLRSLPCTFKNLMLLQHLSLHGCREVMLMSDDFQNIAKLEYLSLSGCEQLQELPRHITNQASLKDLYLNGMKSLRELPIKINELSRLQRMKIGSIPKYLACGTCLLRKSILKSLPNTLGNLSSLTDLSIKNCPNLEYLPTSLGNLSSLINLSIKNCPNLKSLPTSLEDLPSLTNLSIKHCPNLELYQTGTFTDCSWRFTFLD